jgi:hypothetical protein
MNRSVDGIRAGIALAWAAALLIGAIGCAQVRPYQRERLTDRIMSFKAEAKEDARLTKSFEAREGSTGGNGGAGGGCACN